MKYVAVLHFFGGWSYIQYILYYSSILFIEVRHAAMWPHVQVANMKGSMVEKMGRKELNSPKKNDGDPQVVCFVRKSSAQNHQNVHGGTEPFFRLGFHRQKFAKVWYPKCRDTEPKQRLFWGVGKTSRIHKPYPSIEPGADASILGTVRNVWWQNVLTILRLKGVYIHMMSFRSVYCIDVLVFGLLRQKKYVVILEDD